MPKLLQLSPPPAGTPARIVMGRDPTTYLRARGLVIPLAGTKPGDVAALLLQDAKGRYTIRVVDGSGLAALEQDYFLEVIDRARLEREYSELLRRGELLLGSLSAAVQGLRASASEVAPPLLPVPRAAQPVAPPPTESHAPAEDATYPEASVGDATDQQDDDVVDQYDDVPVPVPDDPIDDSCIEDYTEGWKHSDW